MNLLNQCLIPDWPAPPNVRSIQTTRAGGASCAPFDALNLGDHVGDAPRIVAHNRQLLSPLLPSEPVWLQQVHGTHVTDASNATCLPEADACIARRRHGVCVVMTADCLPVLICDEEGTVVGAAHAGWRGLCDGIIEKTVEAMAVPCSSLMVWLGPAIGPQAFEVGNEVREAFISRQAESIAAFTSGATPDKWLADLYHLARLRLDRIGIQQIYGGNFCTFNDPTRFFSYRRDGQTGRMASLIWLD